MDQTKNFQNSIWTIDNNYEQMNATLSKQHRKKTQKHEGTKKTHLQHMCP